MDAYSVLGLPFGAGQQEIKARYRQLALRTHPDRVPPEKRREAEERMKLYNQAYTQLCAEPLCAEPICAEPICAEPRSSAARAETDTQTLYLKARAFLKNSQPEKARPLLNALPKTAETHYLYGVYFEQTGDHLKAARAFSAAYAGEPANPVYRRAALETSAGLAFINKPPGQPPIQNAQKRQQASVFSQKWDKPEKKQGKGKGKSKRESGRRLFHVGELWP